MNTYTRKHLEELGIVGIVYENNTPFLALEDEEVHVSFKYVNVKGYKYLYFQLCDYTEKYKYKKGWSYKTILLSAARVVYAWHFGEVPINAVVSFKDGNSKNFLPENLQLISRKQNAYEHLIKRFTADFSR